MNRWGVLLFFASWLFLGLSTYLSREVVSLIWFYAVSLATLTVAAIFYQLTRFLSSLRAGECVSLTWLVGSVCFLSSGLVTLLGDMFKPIFVALFPLPILLLALTLVHRGHSGRFTTMSIGLTCLMAIVVAKIGSYLIEITEYVVFGT